jgi:hypothetical protein
MRAGNGGVRVAVGNWGIWGRFAPVLRGLVEKSKDFRTAKGLILRENERQVLSKVR